MHITHCSIMQLCHPQELTPATKAHEHARAHDAVNVDDDAPSCFVSVVDLRHVQDLCVLDAGHAFVQGVNELLELVDICCELVAEPLQERCGVERVCVDRNATVSSMPTTIMNIFCLALFTFSIFFRSRQGQTSLCCKKGGKPPIHVETLDSSTFTATWTGFQAKSNWFTTIATLLALNNGVSTWMNVCAVPNNTFLCSGVR